MSHDPEPGSQPQAAARPYPPRSFHLNPLPSANPHIQPLLQQKADSPSCETDRCVQESRSTGYQVPSIDSVLQTLRLEMSRHNETRLILQRSRKTNLQLEELLFQERTFNHSLRVSVQEAEMKRVVAEGKLQASEHQRLYIESPQPTPLSDYKSATFSPSINLTLPSMGDTPSDTSGGKRKVHFTTSVSKRLRSLMSPPAPKSVDHELGEGESEEESEESEEEA